MAEAVTAATLVEGRVTSEDHILLANPPVEETRYNWVRWNQPLDLLKIASYLRDEVGCEVSLLDHMKPDKRGRVPWQRLPGARATRSVGGHEYPMRRYGKPYKALTELVTDRKSSGRPIPTQVWITSLCSYWFKGVSQLCREARTALPDATVVVTGNYPRLLPKHAKDNCPAHLLVEECIDLEGYPAALDLYQEDPPPFLALRLSSDAATEVRAALRRGITRFALFEDDVLREEAEPFRQLLLDTEGLHRHLRFHLLCGVRPSLVSENTANLLADRRVADLFLEEEVDSEVGALGPLAQAGAHLREAGFGPSRKNIGAFVWLGRPHETLEGVIARAINALTAIGGFIFKPYSPTPGSRLLSEHGAALSAVDPQDWSPHFFPFAETNGIHRDEYHDLYRMAAFLNNRVRGKTFDFLAGTLGSELFRSSLEREVWNFDPSSKRTSD